MGSDLARRGLESRLRDFLSAAAPRLRPRRDYGTRRVARLDTFLAAAHPYLLRNEPVPLRPVDTTRLGEVLATLRDPLERQRATGRALNVWTAAGLKRDEVRNTAALAELLRHERLGDVARAFLAAILGKAGLLGYATDGPYRVSTEVCPLANQETRVDLVIETNCQLIGVEVKIDARERQAQLADYAQVLKSRASLDGKTPALIFLSPRQPSKPNTAHITWRDVQQAARIVARQHRNSGHASWLLTSFADHVATFG